MRLGPDDLYTNNESEIERPKPTSNVVQPDSRQVDPKNPNEALLYQETEETASCSAITQSDFESYLRHQSFDRKVNRTATKLFQRIKYLPYGMKHELWKDSRQNMFDAKKYV